MLLLVILQSYTSVIFVFNLTLHVIPNVLGLFSNKLGFRRS